MIYAVFACIRDQHDLRLVVLAGLICSVSTTISFDMLARARRQGHNTAQRWLWVVGAATVASTGVWATHFLAMLAYSTFGVLMTFDALATIGSMVVGWVACVAGFALVTEKVSRLRIAAAGLMLGSGVALLHYLGMYGVLVPYLMIWNTPLIFASIAGSTVFATLAIALFAMWRSIGARLLAATMLTCGVVSLHFTGMAAISIFPELVSDVVIGAVPNSTISLWVIAGISAIAVIAFLTSVFDQVLAGRNVAETRRLSELTRKLEIALDEARAADKAKSEFLAMMSHEIRTPLAGMIGMIDLAYRSDSAAEQKKYAALARESADSLLAVINDVLDFSRLDAGKWEAESVDFDAVKLASSTVETFRPASEIKTVALKLEFPEEPLRWLKGDPTKIRQVLVNLLNNALKFTETGSIEVRVRTRPVAGRVDLNVEVIDSGIGIPPEARKRLFAPFVQEDSSMSRRYGGSGLGLAISRRLCALMGGDIGVEGTSSGVGSRFWFTIPCAIGQQALPATPAPPLASSVSLSILVAEDTPIIGDLITRLLTKAGHHAQLVTNGLDAVAAVKNDRFDVVVMDIQMPQMDGLAATRAIRGGSEPARSLPIIALTANAMANDRKRCLEAGMNDYVTKPIQPTTLLSAIARCARAKDSHEVAG